MNQFLLIFPIFKSLDRHLLELIFNSSKSLMFNAGELILIKDKLFQGIYCLQKGTVMDITIQKSESELHGIGSLISFINLMNSSGNSLVTVQVKSNAQFQFIPLNVMKKCMDESQKFRQLVFKSAFIQWM